MIEMDKKEAKEFFVENFMTEPFVKYTNDAIRYYTKTWKYNDE